MTGEDVMAELISELQASAAAAGAIFEGEDMAQVRPREGQGVEAVTWEKEGEGKQ